jgi:hypothetical protein
MRPNTKGTLIALACVAAVATAWSQLNPVRYAAYASGEASELAEFVWLGAVFVGIPLAIAVGRRAGRVSADGDRRKRTLEVVLIALATSVSASLVMGLVCRALELGDLLGALLLRAIPCAVLAAFVLARWALPAPADTPVARTVQ